jgi:hypothetical protein
LRHHLSSVAAQYRVPATHPSSIMTKHKEALANLLCFISTLLAPPNTPPVSLRQEGCHSRRVANELSTIRLRSHEYSISVSLVETCSENVSNAECSRAAGTRGWQTLLWCV